MSRPPRLPAVVAGLLCASVVSAAELEALAWLSGCWARPNAEAGSGEFWQPLAGGTMLGVGRTIRNGKTVQYEFLRLHTDDQGRIVYTAIPSRQRETAFLATQVTTDGATFENPTHDFPQKIIYTREGPEGMLVRIEGPQQGQTRGIDFRFAKVPCPK